MNGGTWVLLRGLTRERGHWGDFAGRLADRAGGAGVLALDLPGAGARWRERSPASIAAITEDCRRQLRDHAGPLRVLGLSMGGMVALDWAVRHPGELQGVVMVNSSLRPFGAMHQRLRPAVWAPLLRALIGGEPQAVEWAILRCTSAWPERQAAALARWVQLRRQHPVSRANALRQLWAAARFAAPALPPATPVRLLCSAADALVDPGCSRRLARAWSLPLSVHPGAGHDLPLDDPDWVIDEALKLGPPPEPPWLGPFA